MDFENKKLYTDLIGVNTLILFSKEIFKKNEEIEPYIKEVFDLQFKNYLYRSRTLLIARTNKHIYNLSSEEAREKLKIVKTYLDKENRVEEKNEKKNTAKENLKTWLEKIW